MKRSRGKEGGRETGRRVGWVSRARLSLATNCPPLLHLSLSQTGFAACISLPDAWLTHLCVAKASPVVLEARGWRREVVARRRALPVQDDAQGGRCIRSAAHAWFLVARRPVMTLFPSLSLFASSLIIDWEKKEKEEASVCWEKGSSSRILGCKSCQERDRRRRLRCATSAPHKPALRSPFQLCLYFPHSNSSLKPFV